MPIEQLGDIFHITQADADEFMAELRKDLKDTNPYIRAPARRSLIDIVNTKIKIAEVAAKQDRLERGLATEIIAPEALEARINAIRDRAGLARGDDGGGAAPVDAGAERTRRLLENTGG